MSRQHKFFPGWLVVASGFVVMATCYTIFVNCMSLFQPLIVSDLGITLAQYNISNAISTVVGVIGSLVIGHVADKVNGRVLGSLTVIATSAVLAGMSFVGELWQVYVLFCSPRSVCGCPGSRMDARTIIRFPRRPRAYEMIRFPPSPRGRVIRRGRRKTDRKQRRRIWPNESPYPRSVRRAAALLLCAV